MTNKPATLSRPGEAEAEAKARRAERTERQETCLDGAQHCERGEAIQSQRPTAEGLPRLIAAADSARRKLQNLAPNALKSLARLSTLRVARVVRLPAPAAAKLDRGSPAIASAEAIRSHGPMAGGTTSSPTAPHDDGCGALASKVAELGAQDIEIARAPVDFAGRGSGRRYIRVRTRQSSGKSSISSMRLR
jgi:hypothetical protein